MSSKNKLERIEKRIDAHDPDQVHFEVSWCVDGLCEWKCEDGSIEMITRDEFKRRGGILLSWDPDLRSDALRKFT
jgi:hypothetical protein